MCIEINRTIDESTRLTLVKWADEHPGEWLAIHDDDLASELESEVRSLLWTFHPNFLAMKTGLRSCVFGPSDFRGYIENRIERNNKRFRRIIAKFCPGGVVDFVRAAVAAEGAGKFLAPYDHEECKVKVQNTTWHLFRTN
jgi:hypothetical protein